MVQKDRGESIQNTKRKKQRKGEEMGGECTVPDNAVYGEFH